MDEALARGSGAASSIVDFGPTSKPGIIKNQLRFSDILPALSKGNIELQLS